MALIHMDLFSRELMRTVPLTVVLPTDKVVRDVSASEAAGPFKTLYLLHGIFGSCIDWLSGTPVQRWAEERDLAVVMPSGENMFYLDHDDAHACYGHFVGEELPRLMRRTFPLSAAREDTYIGGLSMGGYGALRTGLRYPETFGAIAALSPVPLMRQIEEAREDAAFPFARPSYFRAVAGELGGIRESDANPVWLARRFAQRHAAGLLAELPRIFCACGTADSLRPGIVEMCHELEEAGATIAYEEHAGGHDWDFWTWGLRRALDWLPLDTAEEGLTSGNIGLS